MNKTEAAKLLGRLGGKAGRGASKARSREHYRIAQQKAAAVRRDARSALTRPVHDFLIINH